ncbi:MAG: caspase family protein, partial [Cyanobacteria bacterium]|nr:caspase family protein [Cyanobacteriota bacterium]
MSRIRRRHFLQLAGSSLAAIGLSQVDFLRHGNQMHRALAQTTPRKLALLVGINNYPTGISSLGGCVNDVRLQYELLVHRYGFNPQDILIVTDSTSASGLTWAGGEVLAGATREQIIQAFQGHLGMAQPGDVALFHYSGHGSYVKDPHPIDYANSPEYLDIPGYQDFEGFDGTLVPTDSLTRDRNKVNDIMGSTLFLLSRGINTDNFTMVLDSCHAGGGVRGNLVYRSVNREAGEGRNPSDQEMELQTTLRQQVGLGEDDAFKNAREAGIAKGVAMGAARANQLAAEQSHSGLQAGIFTYLLTRYLWQVSSSRPLKDMFVDLARITRAVDQGENQDPIYFVQPGTALDQEPPYLMPPSTVAAEAAIRSIRSNQSLELWLGGMTPNALKAENSIYEVLDQDGTAIARVQQVSGIYDGLTADAHFIDANGNRTAAPENVGPGSLLQEEIRGLNTDFKLTVGLHQSLGADLEEARQVLANYDFLTPTVANGASDTDILLGRFDDTVRSEVNTLGLSGRVDVEALGSGVLGLVHNDLKPLL